MISKTIQKLRAKFVPSFQDLEYRRYLLSGGDQELRFSYPLKQSSLVLDVGGYEGQFASDLYSRYRCKILIFEPVKQFFDSIQTRFSCNPDITAFRAGLSGTDSSCQINLAGDGSSTLLPGRKLLNFKGSSEEVQLFDVKSFLADYNIERIDLLKINIEGGEYDLLERMIESGDILKCKALQIQFHHFCHDAVERRKAIRAYLKNHFTCSFCYEWIWESWIANQ